MTPSVTPSVEALDPTTLLTSPAAGRTALVTGARLFRGPRSSPASVARAGYRAMLLSRTSGASASAAAPQPTDDALRPAA